MRTLWPFLPAVDPATLAFAIYIIACIFVGAWHIGCASARFLARVWECLS